jgi:hypothetical protein
VSVLPVQLRDSTPRDSGGCVFMIICSERRRDVRLIILSICAQWRSSPLRYVSRAKRAIPSPSTSCGGGNSHPNVSNNSSCTPGLFYVMPSRGRPRPAGILGVRCITRTGGPRGLLAHAFPRRFYHLRPILGHCNVVQISTCASRHHPALTG